MDKQKKSEILESDLDGLDLDETSSEKLAQTFSLTEGDEVSKSRRAQIGFLCSF